MNAVLLPGGSIAAPEIPDDVADYCRTRARGDGTTLTPDRLAAMLADAIVIERAVGALLWTPAAGRRCVSVVQVDGPAQLSDLPVLGMRREDVRQEFADDPTVERRDETDGSWSPVESWRPRISVYTGIYRISGVVAAVDPAVLVPANEALARLWSYHDANRPADVERLEARPAAAVGGMRKSGAESYIRAVGFLLGGVSGVPM